MESSDGCDNQAAISSSAGKTLVIKIPHMTTQPPYAAVIPHTAHVPDTALMLEVSQYLEAQAE